MNPGTIELLIKWGPLALIGIIFLVCFLVGLIRGSYKVMRRLVYVVLYVVLIWIFIDNITGFVLDFNIPFNDLGSVRKLIKEFIEGNETITKFLEYSPEMKALIIDSPEIIVSPILFVVLILIGLPLSFPIYWIYLLIWHIFAKCVLKREKYQKDEDGNILRDEKGKKIKVRRRKHRLVGGFVRGAQGVALICVVLLPVNFVNRIYNNAKVAAELEKGETLCGSIGLANIDEQICRYIDAYNGSITSKLSGNKSLDKFINDRLTSVKINGEKVSLEKELSNLAVSFVYLNDSGLLDLLTNSDLNLDTLDLSILNFDKINLAIDSLFSSYVISNISEAGVKYVMNEVLNDRLIDLLKDDDIVSKLEYEDSDAIQKELKDVVDIIKYAVEKNIDNIIINDKDNVISIVNNVDSSDVESLLNKLLTLRIVSNAMPSALKAYGEEYGINGVEQMTSELNNEISKNLVNALKFVKTMELTSMDELNEGDLVDNLANALFVNGALKTNSKDSLATLLHELNSSYLFKNVISSQVNKLLEEKDYKVDARVLKYVESKEAWLKELDVLENAYVIYDEYNESETINYDNITNLLNLMSGTKVMISVLPFAYDEMLPEMGIEIDNEGLPVIDFDGENEDASKSEFYDTWEAELLVLKNVADSIEVLELQSLEDITVELLDDEENVDALATVMSEVYKSELLKEPFVDYMKDTINEFVVDYEVEFTKEELLSIDTKEKWENEFANINNVLDVDFGNEENITGENLSNVFDAVGSMELFKTKKIDILKYAIRESEFLTQEEYDSINWPSNDDQASVDAFWDNETSVLVDIVDEKDTIETLSTNVDLKTLDTDEIGGLLNRTMESNILNTIVTNKVSELFIDNDVRDDRDSEDSTVNLKNSISSVSDWKEELASIKEILNINEENMNEVIDGNTRVEEMFVIIEESELLQNTRANLLLKAVKTINISEVPSEVTVDVLKANDYEKYDNEKNVIIDVSKEKDMFDDIATMDLKSIDIVKIGELLDTVISSIIFKDYVADEIVKVFVSNELYDDRDYGSEYTINLKNSVVNVTSWENELEIIKDMLNMTGDNFDEVVNGKTRVEIMFDNFGNSELLKYKRANLLIKAIDTIKLEDVSVPSDVTVATLSNNAYDQYDKEINVFITFAENIDAVDGLDDITALNEESRGAIANVLDAMKESKILEDKYVNTLDIALSSINNNQDLRDYGVVFKTKEQTNNYKDIVWVNEINSLTTISDNINTVSKYDETSIDTTEERLITIGIIGSTLDAVSSSAFLGDEQADMIADSVISALTNGLINEVSKDINKTWSQVFTEALEVLDSISSL